MSGEVLVKILPTGSKQVVEQLNLVGSKKFIQISRRMFDAVPVFDADMLFTDAERDSLMVVLQVPSTAELNCLLRTMCELWKNIAYHQLKLEALLGSLEDAGFNADLRNAVVKIWTESGLSVCDRLRDMSYTGRPNVLDVQWTLRMDMASHNNPSLHEIKAILQFDTDQGTRIAELNRAELVELHRNLQDIQDKLDSLL